MPRREDSGASKKEAPVEVVEYDPSWPDLFREEQSHLSQALSACLIGEIQHVGSTAVPGVYCQKWCLGD